MKSSVMKIVSWIYTIASVIGSFVLAFGNEDMYRRLDISNIVVLVIGLVSTAFTACILFAITAILENTEKNSEMLTQLMRQTRPDTSGTSNSKATLSGNNTSSPAPGKWKCPDCGKPNSLDSKTCYYCGYRR